MIIFFNKITGLIEGTIAGRTHAKEELNMWIGDKAETDRVIIEWVEGFPDHKQKDLFTKIEEKQESIFDYKINLKTLELTPKPKENSQPEKLKQKPQKTRIEVLEDKVFFLTKELEKVKKISNKQQKV